MDGQGSKGPAILSNSESSVVVDGYSEGIGVSSVPERKTGQTKVKVPKCWLNAERCLNP